MRKGVLSRAGADHRSDAVRRDRRWAAKPHPFRYPARLGV